MWNLKKNLYIQRFIDKFSYLLNNYCLVDQLYSIKWLYEQYLIVIEKSISYDMPVCRFQKLLLLFWICDRYNPVSKNVLIRSKYIMTSLNVLLIPPFDGSRDGLMGLEMLWRVQRWGSRIENGLTERVDRSIEMVWRVQRWFDGSRDGLTGLEMVKAKWGK